MRRATDPNQWNEGTVTVSMRLFLYSWFCSFYFLFLCFNVFRSILKNHLFIFTSANEVNSTVCYNMHFLKKNVMYVLYKKHNCTKWLHKNLRLMMVSCVTGKFLSSGFLWYCNSSYLHYCNRLFDNVTGCDSNITAPISTVDRLYCKTILLL